MIKSKNNKSSLINSLEQLNVHDHLCLIYKSHEEQLVTAIPFIRIGLERGEQCIYIADDNNASVVLDAMRTEGIDVDSTIKSGALSVVTKREAYLKQGYFDPDLMIIFLKEVTDAAKSAGFKALRVTGEMTWALGGDRGVDRLMEYESKLNYFFPGNDALAICQYNYNRFEPEVIRDVIYTHPIVIYGAMVCENLYYVPPDEFLKPNQTSRQVERLLNIITERKQVEEKLHRTMKALKTLSECNQILVRSADESDLLHGICRVIVEVGCYRLAWIGYAQQDEKRTVKPVAQAGYEEGYLDTLNITWADTERGRGPTGTAIRSAKPAICKNMLTDPHFAPWSNEAIKLGYASSIVLPLIDDGQTFGALNIYATEPDAFDDEEVKLLTELSNDLAYGIMALRTRAERKQAEEALKLNESRLEILLKLNQMTGVSLKELTNFALEEAIRLTRSKIGYFAFMNEEETVLTMHTWSKIAMEECSISDKPIVYPVETTGLWGEAVRQRKPIITNDYTAPNPLKKGYPEGHVQLTRHMNIPIFDGDRIVIVAGVGNKPSDYDESDVRQLTLQMQGMWRIIQRRKAEEELRSEKTFTENALNSLSDVFFVFDLNGKFLRWNKMMTAVSGYSDAEISSMKPTDFFLEEDRQRVMEAIGIAAREGHATVEARVVTKNGRNIPFEFTGSLLTDSEKKPLGVCGVGRDITERKKAEEAMERLRRQHELILNSAGEGILGLDLQGNHTFVNPAAARMLGYEVGEIIGRQSHAIWHHSKADGSPYPKEECEINAVYRDWAVNILDDEVFWRKDGTSFPVSYTSTPILEDGKIIGTVVTFRDITERKSTEESLRETRDYMEKLLNYANAPIVVWDPKFTITGFNHAFERLTGYKDKEVIGLKLHMLFPEASPEESLKKIAPTSSSEYWESVEIPILCKDGSIRLALWNSANIYAKDATTLIATIAQGQDITERKQAVEALKRSHDELEMRVTERTRDLEDANLEFQVLNKELDLRRQEADDAKLQAMEASRAKSDFLANMSHELRTPLNAIIGFSDMMFQGMTGKLTEQQHDYLGDISESGEHLLSLINDILDLSKVEAGKMELELSEFDLKEFIERSFVMFKEKALKHNIKVKYEVDERIGSITADERRLKQVMFNLLSNAFKFTPDGGSVSVQARLIHDENKMQDKDIVHPESCIVNHGKDFIEISVEDTGIGIRHEDFDKIFQPFQQLEYTLTKKYDGTGLGLTLCKKIVELHNGRIWVESEVGKGSKFTFVIPVRQVKDKEE